MRIIKFLVGIFSGATLGLLFAKKSGKDLRESLKGKSNEEKAKLIGHELLEIGKEIANDLKDLPENKQVQVLVKLGKGKLEKLIKEAKSNGNHILKDHLPKLEQALRKLEGEFRKKAVKVASETKSKVVKKASEVKKKIAKKIGR